MVRILWVDDEIDLLKTSYTFSCKKKTTKLFQQLMGQEALDILEQQLVEIVFLDENMPGFFRALETLNPY